MPTNNLILITEGSKDYELIDSGEGEKLERFGSVVISRPDPQALWKKNRSASEWTKAVARFSAGKSDGEKTGKKAAEKIGAKKPKRESNWKINSGVPQTWPIECAGEKFLIKPAAFKHVGLFPEQAAQWKWIKEVIAKSRDTSSGGKTGSADNEPISVLNLFGYTGGATLAAAAAGASVTHVDGSKPAVSWAKENAALSGLDKKPIRWIVDDVSAFVKREIRRGNHYDAIIMDPPVFGRGPQGEVWKIEDELLGLLADCQKILSTKPLFFLLNGYASGYSAIAYEQCLAGLVAGIKGYNKEHGSLEAGELAIRESGSGRLLPAGIFARWSAFEDKAAPVASKRTETRHDSAESDVSAGRVQMDRNAT